ncbi:MAG TPA: serine/threonine-protein kinase, partial [Planctomycetota bacterium]|nr:serine/threonine-protein kinase [Planctomycetota bacterium]
MARQEDFLFAERALQRGWVTDPQVQECLSLLERLRGEMKIDETLPALLVKKGYLAPAQANVLDAEVDRNRADRPKNAIEGYRLLARIGAGAMGSVYEAEHLKLMVPVALKVLNPSLSSSRTQIERLKREAQLAARLNHPNVVRSLDVGESNGFHYLAMEFVEGETVRDRIAKGPMPEAEALGIVRQVAAGLAHAHAHGVVHRDVKPGNIMLTPDGTAKLGDFGLARGQGPSDLTLEHASIGTPQYVAPEQMRRGSDATARSDLFSLGATLYHMVTGRAPFDGETLGEIVQNVLACRFAPPESLAPELSRDAIFVIDRLMRASPRERYASADELVADLERIGRGEPIAPADFRGDYHAFLAKRRGKRNAILAACAIVLVAAGGFQILRAHSRAKREKLAQVCRAADATREDAGALGSAKELAAAIAGMDQARADAGAAGCGETAVAALGARLRAARFARTALDNAERIGKGSGDRKFRELDGSLSGYERQVADLDPAFPGALGRIAGIRGDLQAESDKAAKDRYDRRVLEGFRDLGTAMREAEAFAADLETRYLPLAAPWIGNVAQAPRMLKDLEVAWRAVEMTRERLDEEMRKERPSYRFAVGEVASLRKEENAALDPIATNPYLSGLMALADADKRAGPIGTAERTEWRRVLARANGLIEDGEADRAESVVREFRDRASSELQEVEAKLREVGAELKAVTEKQLALFDAEEQEYRTR